MPYVAADQEVEEFNKIRLGLDRVDVKRGPDRFRMGYHEVRLEGYNCRSLWRAPQKLYQFELEGIR